MIAIVDYGVGNIRAFANVYKQLNIPCSTATTTAELRQATRLILPGVGAFDHAMERLEQSGMMPALNEQVIERKIPVLGICVGMQMMAQHSEEGTLPGLGWIDASVCRFRPFQQEGNMRLPHMGWNDVQPVKKNMLLPDAAARSRYYFLHSYYFSCNQPEDRIAVTEFGEQIFESAINRDHIYGVQFHPEKSHGYGLQLLKNFALL